MASNVHVAKAEAVEMDAGGAPAAPRGQKGLFPATWRMRLVVVVVLALIAVGPFVTSLYQMSIAVAIGIGVIGAVATNLLLGVAGQASIGNAAFMAIGAFTAADTATEAHWPFLLCILAAGVVAAVIGIIVAIPAMRVRGLYLIIATLALHYIAIYVLTRLQAKQVGGAGYLMPTVSFGDLTSIASWYYVIALVSVVAVVAMRNLLLTRYGRAWSSIARDETVAKVLGVRVWRLKIVVFAFSSFIIGIQGGLFAYYTGAVTIDSFTLDLAISYIAMIVIGGIGSVGGSVIGAAFVIGLPYVITWIADTIPSGAASANLKSSLFDIQSLLYGLAIVVFLVWERRGLIHLWHKLVELLRSRGVTQRKVARDA